MKLSHSSDQFQTQMLNFMLTPCCMQSTDASSTFEYCSCESLKDLIRVLFERFWKHPQIGNKDLFDLFWYSALRCLFNRLRKSYLGRFPLEKSPCPKEGRRALQSEPHEPGAVISMQLSHSKTLECRVDESWGARGAEKEG